MKKIHEERSERHKLEQQKTEDDINRITLSILNGQLEEDEWMRNRAE